MERPDDNSKPWFPLAGEVTDGFSKEGEATATCLCGAVQLSFPTEGPGYLGAWVCNCADCRKLTASMFATNFVVTDDHLKHLRGQEKLKTYILTRSIAREGKSMTNYWCDGCGTLMYRKGSGWPGQSLLRVGTIDDFNLAETKIKPTREDFIEKRVSWFHGAEGVKGFEGFSGYPK